ncbi:MAG TPA: GNAT family N-acetyltransferase [Stellaceae bacterium]|nr:GNAT family N-acetyltransferase [Stellaceae bacterium]
MHYRDEQSVPRESTEHPLDDVIWRALIGVQSSIAEGDERARRYPAAVAPFAATIDLEPASFESLLGLIGSSDDRIALFTPVEVRPPSAFSVLRRDVVDQMILVDAEACKATADAPIAALGMPDVPEMLALVSATRPGPFGPRTIELGEYWGVRRHDVLVAIAGERMRLDGFTEISAVCVDAAYRGHGLAADLVRSLAASIVARSEIPFLHVFTSNHRAIALYRKLGFALRRRMHLAVLGRASLKPATAWFSRNRE